MSWLASLGIGFITAIVSGFGAIGLGILCVDWYRIPSREGGSGYFVIFLGLIGLVLGSIMGVMAARIVAAGVAPGFVKGLGIAVGSNAGLLAIITFLCWLVADLEPKVHGRPIEMHAEIRCPAGFVLPETATSEKWYVCMGTAARRATSYGDLRVNEAKQVNGRWLIPMTLAVNTSMREKHLSVCLGEKTEFFVVAFPAKPAERHFNWSEWQEGGWETGQSRPDASEAFNLRYRLEIVPEPVPEPSGPAPEEVHAKQAAEESAAFAALTVESTLEEDLRFTRYTQPEERRQKAGELIGRRPNVVAEMSEQILSADSETADRALRSLAFIKPLPAELAAPVGVVGEKVVASLRRFNVSNPTDDPSYQGAADASVLFSSWFQGHHALHDFAGVDGLAQLKVVLELALQREDSYVMKNDVARVAEYYVKEWGAAQSVSK